MTTAHRPTWAPARGGEEQGGMRIFAPSRMRSSKDAAAHTKLKFRQDGQASAQELTAKDLKADLEAKERKHALQRKGINFEEEKQKDLALLEAAPPDGSSIARELVPRAQDADDRDDVDSDAESSDDDSDNDDEEEELKAELERIRKERQMEADRKAAEEARRADEERAAEVRKGNPLLNLAGGGAAAAAAGEVDFGVKRRWDDDVVFKNQTRNEIKAPRRFINDTVRSDFHRRFLDRYMK